MKRKIMKKLVAIICVASLLATCLVGCGSEAENVTTENESVAETVEETEKTDAEAVQDASEETDGTAQEAQEEEVAEAADEAVEVTHDGPKTATEVVAEMTIGWNLGNTFDATGADETSWGNPVTTQEMIQAVADKGFNVLRIPVTWGHHMSAAPDYTIDAAFIDRVAEVVNYGLDAGMYVLIDTHHEPDTWLVPTDDKIDQVLAQFEALWTQVAAYFAEYDEHLIFEGLNEARTKGTAKEWSGGTSEERENVNKLNECFLNVVRNSGGNNATRICVISPYGNCGMPVALSALNKELDDYTAVAIHAYTPYSFTYHTGDGSEQFVWDGHQDSDIKSGFVNMQTNLLLAGIPVIITEFGSVNKNLSNGQPNTQERIKWVQAYLGYAKKYGVPCVWWDNGLHDSGNEWFAIFNRRDCSWYEPELTDAMIQMYQGE